jgi:hypothetical protein
MIWFIFLLTGIILITSLFFWLDKKTLISMVLLMGLCFLIGGDLVTNGLQIPAGSVSTVVGATTTTTQTYTTLTPSNNGWMYSGWLLIFFGFYYLVQVLLFAVNQLTQYAYKIEGVIGNKFKGGFK